MTLPSLRVAGRTMAISPPPALSSPSREESSIICSIFSSRYEQFLLRIAINKLHTCTFFSFLSPQSLLLVLTGYMSLYFHVNNFSDRVMVALTVMLVMASLQSSIQDSLPKTAYFKFIDWWILFVLNTQVSEFETKTLTGTKIIKGS